MAARVTGDTSDDTHLADDSKRRENAAGSSGYAPAVQEGGRMTGDTSVDAHHAGDAFTDTTLALMSYNMGIQNAEIHSGKKWTAKYKTFHWRYTTYWTQSLLHSRALRGLACRP